MALNGVIVYNNSEIFNGFDNVNSCPSEPEYFDTSDSSNSITYTDLSYHTEKMEYHHMEVEPPTSSAVCNIPVLRIENHQELKDQLRFRYKSESGCHGGVKPILKLHNYSGDFRDIFIKVSLYAIDEKSPHVFELEGRQCANGVGWQKLSKDFTAKFSALSIVMKKKEEISSILKEKKKSKLRTEKKKINEEAIDREVREEMKVINLNSGKLCFEAFFQKEEHICDKVFSKPIFNLKSTAAGDLKIIRLSSFSGSASGGDDIILLCEKVRKDDIEIIFFEEDASGQVIWESKAEFNPADIHHQVAIPFRTPRFKENAGKNVQIKLYRKSDGRSGESREFIYKPDDELNHSAKRRKPNPSEELIDQELPNMEDDLSQFLDSPQMKALMEGCSFEGIFNIIEESVTTEADIDIDSLSLSPARSKHKMLKKSIIEAFSSSSDSFQTLKDGIIGILKNRDKKSFLKILPVLLSFKDENANTLLHWAIEEKRDDLKLFSKLCEVAPINLINQANKALMTPLHLAVSKNLFKIVRILLHFGADPNRKDRNGNNSCHLAAKYHYHICLLEILKPLLYKAEKKIIPNIDALNYEGYAPLHLSVITGSKICSKILIQAKANINIADGKSGKTPLHICYETKSPLLEFLLSQPKINKNAEDFKGCAPNSSSSHLSLNQKATVQKSGEICIDMSIESSCANSNSHNKNADETLEEPISEETEKKLCKILDSNDDLWKKLGLYVMDEKELEVIAKMDSTPTKTILNELKKLHEKNYTKKLKNILSDSELKHVAETLRIYS